MILINTKNMAQGNIYDQCRAMAGKVDFLTETWERQWYTQALYQAELWGIKKTRESKEYFSKNHLIDKYNV